MPGSAAASQLVGPAPSRLGGTPAGIRHGTRNGPPSSGSDPGPGDTWQRRGGW